MLRDQISVDAVLRKVIERAVVRCFVHAPVAHTLQIREARTELVTEQLKQPEDHVAVASRVAHDFRGSQAGALLEQR